MNSLNAVIAYGSCTRKFAFNLINSETILIAGESRISSVPGLNDNPQIANFNFDKAQYDLELVSGSGDYPIVHRILQGKIKLSKDAEDKVKHFIESLNDDDDVQKVYTNLDLIEDIH